MDPSMQKDRKILISRIINFFRKQKNSLNAEKQKLLEGTIKELEELYEVTKSDQELQKGEDLLDNIRPCIEDAKESRLSEAALCNTLAQHSLERFEPIAALNLLTLAIEADDTRLIYFLNRASVKEELGQYRSAITDCISCVAICKTYHAAFVMLGNLYYKLHDWRRCVKTYEYALKLDPNYVYFREQLIIARERVFAAETAARSRLCSSPSLPPQDPYRWRSKEPRAQARTESFHRKGSGQEPQTSRGKTIKSETKHGTETSRAETAKKSSKPPARKKVPLTTFSRYGIFDTPEPKTEEEKAAAYERQSFYTPAPRPLRTHNIRLPDIPANELDLTFIDQIITEGLRPRRVSVGESPGTSGAPAASAAGSPPEPTHRHQFGEDPSLIQSDAVEKPVVTIMGPRSDEEKGHGCGDAESGEDS